MNSKFGFDIFSTCGLVRAHLLLSLSTTFSHIVYSVTLFLNMIAALSYFSALNERRTHFHCLLTRLCFSSFSGRQRWRSKLRPIACLSSTVRTGIVSLLVSSDLPSLQVSDDLLPERPSLRLFEPFDICTFPLTTPSANIWNVSLLFKFI